MSDLHQRTLDYYAMVDAGDVAGVVDWFAQDGTYWRPGYEPMVGRAAITDFYSGERVIESGAHGVDAVVVDGQRVAVRGVFRGRLKDGSEVEIGFADFLVYDASERVTERRTYFDSPAV